MNRVPLFKVHHPEGIGEALEKVFESGFITEGEYSDKFEAMFSDFIGNRNCSLVNSCTSALTLAYDICGVGPGTEVITTPMTCMATNEPIHLSGAKIVWADINPTTGNIDPASVLSKITNRTKAIVGVHWSGIPFEIDEINTIGNDFGISVIEDAAHALGATYKGKTIGQHSDHVCFSFQAIKHLTTADGGAIASKSLEVDALIKRLRWFGLDRKHVGEKWSQDISRCGYKFHMNNLNAMIGIRQMKYIDKILLSHKENGKFYDENIINSKITKLKIPNHAESAYWIYTLLVDDRDRLKEHLASLGIDAAVVHIRNDHYSIFSQYSDTYLSGVSEFCSKMINIPVGWWLSAADRDRVVEAVNSF